MKKIVKLIALTFVFLASSTLACAQDTFDQNDLSPAVNKDAALRFGIAVAQIKKFYALDVDDNKLFADAIKGMLNGLDPHSMYLDKEQLTNLKNMTKGDYVGIGIVLSQKHNLPIVVSPIEGSPAAKAGVKPGDYILTVNGKRTNDKNIAEISNLIRGKPGTSVILIVANKKTQRIEKLTVKREVVKLHNIQSRLLPDNYAYIHIDQFQHNTSKELIAAYQRLNKEANNHLNGLILDLRNNPGGILEESAEVTDVFLDKVKLPKDKTIVYTKQRSGKVGTRLAAKTGDMTRGIPMVVLINNGSASASEIVAGALQDYKRAVIVGQPSFGKGSVQALLPLDNETAIKLTTSLYYTPKGRSIQETGIKPDVLVDNITIKSKDENDDAIAFLNNIREKDIEGHFKNGNAKSVKAETPALSQEDEDYQLREAINIIKTIQLLQQQKDLRA